MAKKKAMDYLMDGFRAEDAENAQMQGTAPTDSKSRGISKVPSAATKFVVDSISDGVARLEGPDGKMEEVSPDKLPDDAREGSVLRMTDGQYEVDQAETEARSKTVRNKFDKLLGR